MLDGPEFWVLVAFVIFVALVWKPLGRMIVGALDDRTAKIRADLERAAQLREEAQELLAQYERKHRDAMKEAAEIVAYAKTEAERFAQQARGELEESLTRREELALQHIAAEEARALVAVRAATVDLAIAAASRLIAERLDPQKADALIDEAIKQIPGKLN